MNGFDDDGSAFCGVGGKGKTTPDSGAGMTTKGREHPAFRVAIPCLLH
jgi:hypothetical protein